MRLGLSVVAIALAGLLGYLVVSGVDLSPSGVHLRPGGASDTEAVEQQSDELPPVDAIRLRAGEESESALPSSDGLYEVAPLALDETFEDATFVQLTIGAWEPLPAEGPRAANVDAPLRIYRCVDTGRAITSAARPTVEALGRLSARVASTLRMEFSSPTPLQADDFELHLVTGEFEKAAVAQDSVIVIPRSLLNRSAPVVFDTRRSADEINLIEGLHPEIGYHVSVYPRFDRGECSGVDFPGVDFVGGEDVTIMSVARPVIRFRILGPAVNAAAERSGTITVANQNGITVQEQELAHAVACLPVDFLADGAYTASAAGSDWIIDEGPVSFVVVDGVATPNQIEFLAVKSSHASVIWNCDQLELAGAQVYWRPRPEAEWKSYPTHDGKAGSGILRWKGSEARFLGRTRSDSVGFYFPIRNWVEAVPLDGSLLAKSIPPPTQGLASVIRERATEIIQAQSGVGYVQVLATAPMLNESAFEVLIAELDLSVTSVEDVRAYGFETYAELDYTIRTIDAETLEITDHALTPGR